MDSCQNFIGFSICSLERPKPKILASHVEEFLPLQQLALELLINYHQTQVIHLMGIRPNYYIRWQQYGKTKPESARGESGEIKHQENWGLYMMHNQCKLCTKYVNCV